MNANNARALATMRQKLKKAAKENETDVKLYEEDSEGYEKKFQDMLAALAPAPVVKAKKVISVPGLEDGEEGEDSFTTVGKGGKTYNFTAAGLFKVLGQVAESRGRKASHGRSDMLSY